MYDIPRNRVLTFGTDLERHTPRQNELVGRSKVWAAFARPIKLSARFTAWQAEDIRALIKNLSNQPQNN